MKRSDISKHMRYAGGCSDVIITYSYSFTSIGLNSYDDAISNNT